MHISEGVLTPFVLSGGAILTVAGTAIGLKKLDYDKLVTVALLSAAFFVASLIHVPIGPSAAHLVLNGLLGVILGWAAFPAILIGLALQALLFQFGGITTLGINTFNMALPPIICFYVFRPMLLKGSAPRTWASFSCGFFAIGLSALLTAGSLALSGDSFLHAAQALLISCLPVMVIEGLITAGIVSFLAKVRPEVLMQPTATPEPSTASSPAEAHSN